MRLIRSASLAVAAVLAACATTTPRPPEAARLTAAQIEAVAPPLTEQKICRDAQPTGSHVQQRVCRTVIEDARERAMVRELLEPGRHAKGW